MNRIVNGASVHRVWFDEAGRMSNGDQDIVGHFSYMHDAEAFCRMPRDTGQYALVAICHHSLRFAVFPQNGEAAA